MDFAIANVEEYFAEEVIRFMNFAKSLDAVPASYTQLRARIAEIIEFLKVPKNRNEYYEGLTAINPKLIYINIGRLNFEAMGFTEEETTQIEEFITATYWA